MKYVYVNAKDEKGIPNLQLFHSEPTDEPNGLEISFTCKPGDFYSFQQKAQQVYKWFPERFKVEGGAGRFVWEDRQYCMEGKGWKIRDDSSHSCAIMGYVEYPIEQKHFSSDKSGSDRANDWYKHYDKTPFVQLLNLGLELHFDIGEVEMDISREGLQYTDATVDAIKKRLQAVCDEITAQMQAEFKSCKTLWEARLLLHQLEHGKLKGVRHLMGMAKLEFDGKPITHNINLKDLNKCEVIMFDMGYGRSKPKRHDYVSDLQANDSYAFYVADMDRGNYVAIERVMMTSDPNDPPPKKVYLIKPQGDTFSDRQAAAKEFADTCGMDISYLRYCSTVPKPPKGKRSKQVNVFKFLSDSTRTARYGKQWQKDLWEQTSVDFNDGGLYVEINAWMARRHDGSGYKTVEARDMKEIIDALKALGITIPEVCGIKTAVAKKYHKSKDWDCFFTWAERQLKAHIKTSQVMDHLSDIQALESFSGSEAKLKSVVEYASEKIANSDNPILKLLDKLKELSKIKKTWAAKLENIRGACNLLNVKHPQAKSQNTLETLQAEIEKQYEVLDLVDEWDCRRKNKANKIVRLINLVDSCSKGS
jgi:hypothetical protein